MLKELQINKFRIFDNQTVVFGKYLTVLCGRNSTGKSTILGMIANSGELKKKDGVTYLTKPFRAEFSELFKGSKNFDEIGPNRFTITLCDNGHDTDYRQFRTAWQTKEKHSTGGNSAFNKTSKTSDERFRVIPFKKLNDNKKTEAKFHLPVLYLGLSRLFPIGESKNSTISSHSISFESDEHKGWFIDNYSRILSMHSQVQEVTNYSIGETDQKVGIGINTESYDYLTNSSGQDNLGQILLALLSFKNLREKSGEDWLGGVLLIDEIDATLHPAAQNRLVDLLIREAKENKIQVVVTTHSVSLLKNICSKTSHNDNSVNNDIEIFYFTNANRHLEIKRNITFMEIENDLLVRSIVQHDRKIKLYSEDAEARWFFKHLVPDLLLNIEILDLSIGFNELLKLYNADIQYFGNCLVLFDGDVKETDLAVIPVNVREKCGNIIILPKDDMSPEKVLLEYLLNLPTDHEYFSGPAQRVGFTWDYFYDNNPVSDNNITQNKPREQYKKWFKDHQTFFDSTDLMSFWLYDNSIIVQQFREKVKKAIETISARIL